VQQFLDKNP